MNLLSIDMQEKFTNLLKEREFGASQEIYKRIEKAYKNIEKIRFDGMHYRRDIAQRKELSQC